MLRDFRYALNTLRRSPGYAALCVAVLALGIGANAAIFSVLDAVVLQALPYPDPARLVFVWERFPALPPPVGPRMKVARTNYLEWRRQNTVFSDMAAFLSRQLEETGGERRKIETGFASASLFPMLGATPRAGRLFTSAEETPGSDRVALLTDRFFERRYARDRHAIGKTLAIDGVSYTIAGVLPANFHLPATYEGTEQVNADVWVPLSRVWQRPQDDAVRQLYVAARMKPGVTLAQARAEMDGIAHRLQASQKEIDEGWVASVFPFATEETGPEVHRAIYVLMGAVGFLLLIACANLANLTLARAALRSREIAVRLALGASRARIVAQLATESFVVSIAGAAVGLLLAQWCVKLLLAFEPQGIMRPEAIRIDAGVFAFAAVASVATTLLFGLAPALAASRQDLNTTLKAGGMRGGSAARVRSRQFLIAAEVALALVLVVGAGLMIRSFEALLAVGVGFRTSHVTIADVELPAARYPDDAARSRFFSELLQRARSGPAIEAAAVVDNPPLHRISMSNFYIAGRPDPELSALPIADMAHASTGYFALIGLRLEAGRWFTGQDRALTEKGGDGVAIINHAFAKQFFPGENPLGRRLLSSDRKRASEIVGVVSDFRPMGVENGTRATIFWPDLRLSSATLMVRSPAAAQPVADFLRNTVRSLDANLQPAEVQPMQHYVDGWLSQRKFNTTLLGIFAALALVLGMIGIYGVLSNLVEARLREIGIRMALGASPAAIGRLVVRQSMVPVAIGLAAGLAGSLALGRFLETLLFQVRPRDPLTLALATVSILAVVPAAIYVPLRRATRVDCAVSLRQD